jgi:hypothetical protein
MADFSVFFIAAHLLGNEKTFSVLSGTSGLALPKRFKLVM